MISKQRNKNSNKLVTYPGRQGPQFFISLTQLLADSSRRNNWHLTQSPSQNPLEQKVLKEQSASSWHYSSNSASIENNKDKMEVIRFL